MLGAACSSGNGAESVEDDARAPSSTVTTTTAAPPPTLPDYSEEADSFVDAENDAALPPIVPESAASAYGFSRYVYQETSTDIIPTLIEGPLGFQFRCQELEWECSYSELQAIYDTESELPDYLGMTHDDLGLLLDQLARTEEVVMQHETIEEACAAGLFANSQQAANMGIHMNNPAGTRAEFDPARPTMILFAKEGGEQVTLEEMGNCRGGGWTGDDGHEPVGAVFTLNMSEEHPDAFAGPIDNWHIHLNTCTVGAPEEGTEDIEGFETDVPIVGKILEADVCAASGGRFLPVVPMWMMHAYVAPKFEPQGGVFAMFNPSIWPIADTPDAIRNLQTCEIEGAISAPITNFDSGLFGTGESFELSFDEAGEYDLFCVLHPQMTATVTME
jgi:hypothetical protein